ncbi:MAG: choice-of-anchor tandem repeat GloVer-containing protein [Verrucomicrobiota bacterium]
MLNTFSVTNGANPESLMIQTAGGHFWGSTEYGGAIPGANQGGNGFGVLFNLETNGALVDRFDFGKTNGSSPNELLLGQDGNYYGTTTWGGNTSFYVYGFGTIFKLTPDGALSTLYTFSGFADGGFLYGGLAQAADGYLYGSTFSGGAYGYGTLFRISTNGQFSTIYNFTGGSDGANPAATLLVGPDGNLYGTTYNGGYGYGSVFQFTPSGNGSTLVLFTGMTGGFPGSRSQTPLVLGSDGNLYGATVYGGPSNQGTLFRVSTPFPPAWQSITQTNGIVTLSWNAILTQTYQVQYINDLAPSGWSVLGGNILATNANMSVPDAMGSNTRRFYRLGILP